MNKKGFTLIEMLAVIAIIAVLVAIVIPTVSSATEKAKEAADVANIRAAVAEVTTKALSNGVANHKAVTMTQGTKGFVIEVSSIGGISSTDLTTLSNTINNTVVYVCSSAEGAISISSTEPTYPAG